MDFLESKVIDFHPFDEWVQTNHWWNHILSYCHSELEPMTTIVQWLFLVPLIGGRWYISSPIGRKNATYIPLIYCQLDDYMVPIPPIKGTRNSCWQQLLPRFLWAYDWPLLVTLSPACQRFWSRVIFWVHDGLVRFETPRKVKEYGASLRSYLGRTKANHTVVFHLGFY